MIKRLGLEHMDPEPDAIGVLQHAGRRVITIAQLRWVYGVTRRTVYTWMAQHRIAWVQGLHHRYIYVDSVPLFEDMLASRRAAQADGDAPFRAGQSGTAPSTREGRGGEPAGSGSTPRGSVHGVRLE